LNFVITFLWEPIPSIVAIRRIAEVERLAPEQHTHTQTHICKAVALRMLLTVHKVSELRCLGTVV